MAKRHRETLKQLKVRGMEWRRFRKDHLMTQVQLAQAMGISPRSVQAVENVEYTPTSAILAKFRTLAAKHEVTA